MMCCKPILFLMTILFYTKGLAQSKVSVDISNFRSSRGVCHVCLYDNVAGYEGDAGKPFSCKKIKVNNKKAHVVFEQVPSGTYAIMTFHDANSNNKMDTNFLGIPVEGYGASKNNLPFAAAPTFNANRFEVENNKTVHLSIKLRNL